MLVKFQQFRQRGGDRRHTAHVAGHRRELQLPPGDGASRIGTRPAGGRATSSARGLFQFIEQTWLATMKQSGSALGYGHYAAAITQTATGRYEVTDQVLRLWRVPARVASSNEAAPAKKAATDPGLHLFTDPEAG